MKNLLLEVELVDATLVEEDIDEKTKERTMTATVKWQQADIINNNNRRYRRNLLEREIAKMNELIKQKAVYGASYHPPNAKRRNDCCLH